MLLEVEGEQVRVLAGLGMRARLVQVLGPVRALRVAQAVARMGGLVLGVDWNRQQLLQQMAMALGGWIVWRGFGRFVSPPIERYAPAEIVEVLMRTPQCGRLQTGGESPSREAWSWTNGI